MPTHQEMSVFVQKGDGSIFTEYDTRNLRTSSSRCPVISSKILCEDNQKFTIKINSTSALSSLQPNPNALRDPYNLRSTKGHQSQFGNVKTEVSGFKSVNHDVEIKKFDDSGRWRLSVEVFIDGNPIPECAAVVSLGKELILGGRWSQDAQGRVFVDEWVFTSVGIEHLLQGMKIEPEDYEIPNDSLGRDLMELQKKLAGDILAPTEPKSTRGIEVRVARVRTWERYGVKPSERKYAGDHPHSQRISNEDDVTHTVGVTPLRKKRIHLKRKGCESWDEDGKSYVSFRFQYMAKHKLFNLGLCKEDGTPTVDGQLRRSERIAAKPVLPSQTLKRSLNSDRSRSTSSDDRKPLGGYNTNTGSDGEDCSDEAKIGAADRSRKRRNLPTRGTQLTLSLPVRSKVSVEAKGEDALAKEDVKSEPDADLFKDLLDALQGWGPEKVEDGGEDVSSTL
jgi:hypothetical protein